MKRYEQNASQSWTHRLQPVSVTKSSCNFNFSTPGYDTLMGAQLFLEVKYAVDSSAVYVNNIAATLVQTYVMEKRDGYPLTSDMRSCALTLNGQSISYKPNTFIKELIYLNIGRSQGENRKCCEPLEVGKAPIYGYIRSNGSKLWQRTSSYTCINS